MPSQSLYRKWRSQTFADLIGQEAVVRTLLNAVRDGRIAHAYLFCGPRGTGKTSAARLLAKAINCQHPRDGEPCNECVSCQEIAAGRSPDVIEIDAASNNGVDDVRGLRENVSLMGSGGRYKLYIVDEAHMLSTQAWNAFLKTLEEPPPHVVFVFATTEAQKLLPTVISRCQRFDFRRFRMADLVARLQHVAQGEGLTLAPAAADLLARAAQGGMRDALSLLDQAVAFCGDTIDLERTRAMLGLADVGALRRLIACIADDQPAEALDLLNELVVGGADLRQLNGQLAEEWRALLLARAGADLTRVMDFTEEQASEVNALAGRFSLDELMACARVFARNETPARGLPVPQLALELSLLECVAARRHETPAVAPRPAAPAAAPAAPAAPAASPTRPAAPTHAPQPAAPSAAQPRAPQPPDELDLAAIDAEQWQRPAAAAAPSSPHASAATTPAPIASSTADEADWEPTPGEPTGGVVAAAGDGRDWVAEALRAWPLVRKVCRQQQTTGAMVSGLLSAAEPIRWEPGTPPTLVIKTRFELHLAKFRDAEKREVVEWALEQALGAPLRAHFVFIPDTQDETAPAQRGAVNTGASRAAPQTAAPGPQVYERSAPGYGTNGATAVSAATSGVRPGAGANGASGGRSASPVSSSPRAAQPTPARRPSAPAAAPASRDQLDQAAREDPVVQEFARALKLEVSEVRALHADDAAEDAAGDDER